MCHFSPENKIALKNIFLILTWLCFSWVWSWVDYETTRIPEILGCFLNLNKIKTKWFSTMFFTIEHKYLIWEILQLYAQNELICYLMPPATGLKIVGMGACLPWRSISSSFQNSLNTFGHRSSEFLEFWCWNLVPFLPDIVFQLLKSLLLSLTYFLFNDARNVLYRLKIWTAGRPIQNPDSSTMKPCCCNSCCMWFCIVLLKCTRPSLK